MSGYYRQRAEAYTDRYGLELAPWGCSKPSCEIFWHDNYSGDEESRDINPVEAARMIHLLQNYLMAHAAYTEGRTS